MSQKEKRIYEFKKGDIIVKLKPLMDSQDGFKDYSLVGKKVVFLGIANASVYLSKAADFLTKMFMGIDNNTIQLPLELWEDGWGYYVEPDFIEEESPIMEDEGYLKEQIEEAIKTDDYEKADRLKKKMEELKDRRKKSGDKDNL